MFRSPLFWVAFIVISIAAAAFSAVNFSSAFPLVSIDVRMDRSAALAAARDLAGRFAWPPDGFDQAVAFGGNPEVQSFIELEGGGKEELARVQREGLFAPYTWEVRHYREGDAHETRIRFTPEGRPHGFRLQLPEQEAGAALERGAAQSLAEQAARDHWSADFTRYSMVESSEVTRPGGRKDHTFVYERQDARLGEGRYRLRLVVSGDGLTELTYFIQVPEAFSRRYQEMRSSNDAISAFSTVALFGVYIVVCCGIGLFFLVRKHWVLWRQAAAWSLAIGLMVAAGVFNSWPSMWMSYDTAIPASGFVMQQFVLALLTFGAMAALLVVSFIAAESLSRAAFPHHVQLWKLWSPPVAASKTAFGQTAAGYLLVSMFFAYEVVLYTIGHSRLGWWTPSDTLINPDLFSSYLPSLSAVSNSLQAGFWEECLFRAVPLASAALIGDKLGARRPFIVIAMIVQALIFGAGHAGYANQPAYARVVELVIPSLAFGGLYLAFGLLPGIILHYAFDLVWFSMPIFMSSGPRARIEQVLVLVLAFVPLMIGFAARARMGRWTELGNEFLNRAWSPQVRPAPPHFPETLPSEESVISPGLVRVLPVAGIAGLIVWFAFSDLGADVPRLELSRSEAERAASQALADRDVSFDTSWKIMSRVEAQLGDGHRFVYRTAGREKYDELLGTYLPGPLWMVRFAKFDGDVAARAEEYQVFVADPPRPMRVRHQLAEASPGRSLGEDEARAVARSAATREFQIPAADLHEISAEADKRPMRTDWTFQFSDQRIGGLGAGEARISVVVAGDEVADAARYVHVPEEWLREERARRNLPGIISVLCILVLGGLAGLGVVNAIISWSRKRVFSVPAFLAFFGAILLLFAAGAINNWPVTISALPTAQPFMLQVIVVIALGSVLLLIVAAGLGLLGGSVLGASAAQNLPVRRCFIQGLSLGAVAAALLAAARLVAISQDPDWPGAAGIAALVPFLAAMLNPVSSFLTQALVLSTLLLQISGFSSMWRRRRNWALALLVFMGLVLAGSLSSPESAGAWLVVGAVTGAVLALSYVLAFRHAFAMIPATLAMMVVLETLAAAASRPYPASLSGAIAGSVLVLLAAWIWCRAASKQFQGRPV